MNGTLPAAVQLRQISRRFGPVLANDRVDLQVWPGTIHALIGENGAGKSTAMNILYGVHRPDAGEIYVRGKRCIWRSPRDAIAGGIGMIHQHFMLAGPISVLDNVLLGAEPLRGIFLDRAKARSRVEEIASNYGMEVDLASPVEELSVGLQQRVEILKLLFRDANILILDEPTAVLSPAERERLFRNLNQLRDQGRTVILVTHKLTEVIAYSQRVTVIRQGRTIGTYQTQQTTAQELASLMVGRSVALPEVIKTGRTRSPVLNISGLRLPRTDQRKHALHDVNLTVHAGEIVGIAGVEGNGQSELFAAILDNPGTKPETGAPGVSCRADDICGQVTILGKNVAGWDMGRIRRLGVGVVPEDRHGHALLPRLSVLENFVLGNQRRPGFCCAGFIRWAQVRTAARRAMKLYDVRATGLAAEAGSLSGGNQQKLILAREFQDSPRLLLASQPTRGVDIQAVQFIHSQIVNARDSGAGVLLVSSDLEEIIELCDRILVMFGGRFVTEYARGRVNEQELALKMGGG